MEIFLSLRRFQVLIGSTLPHFYFQESVLQGSILSITLFSIKINGILNQLPNTVHSNLNVDDLNIFCREKDMLYIEQQLQLVINRIIRWTNQHDFSFYVDKTHCVLFYCVCGMVSIRSHKFLSINDKFLF